MIVSLKHILRDVIAGGAATSGSSLAPGFLGLGFPRARAWKNTRLKKNKHVSCVFKLSLFGLTNLHKKIKHRKWPKYAKYKEIQNEIQLLYANHYDREVNPLDEI